MRNKNKLMLLVAAAVLLAALPTGRSLADRVERKRSNSAVFSHYGVYTGSVKDKMQVGKIKYRFTPQTKVRVVGNGEGKVGMYVSKSGVVVSGERVDKDFVVKTVIVRATQPMSKASIRANPNLIPSEENPNVGEVSTDEGF
jgi:hypothetical protein